MVLENALAIQFESAANDLNNFRFDIDHKVDFDDFVPIEPIAQNDTEVMGYKRKTLTYKKPY